MVNIYDTANQLAQEIKQTNEFQELKAAIEALKQDPEAYACYQKIREIQKKMQAANLSGEDVNSEDLEKAASLANEASNYAALSNLMSIESRLNTMFDDLSKILFEPMQELYRF